MATSQSRERIIRAAWEERGRAEWDPEAHGRGLLSLNIPATAAMRPIRFGEPRPPYDNLEFHLVHATMGGQPVVNSIVCEDVVVETVEGRRFNLKTPDVSRTYLKIPDCCRSAINEE